MNRRKKIRGAKRHLRAFSEGLFRDELKPIERGCRVPYGNHKIGIYEQLLHISSKVTSCILNEYLKSAQKRFENNRKEGEIFTVILSHPNLFSSELCVFYDQSYFESFLDRNNEYQQWTRQEHGVVELYDLTTPDGAEVINYKERIVDEDFSYTGVVTVLRLS